MLEAANVILGTVAEGTMIKAALPPEGGVTVTRMLRAPQVFKLSVAVKVDVYVAPFMRFCVSVVIALKSSVIAQGSAQKHYCCVD